MDLIAYCQTNGIQDFHVCGRGRELPPSIQLTITRNLVGKALAAEHRDASDE